MREADREPPIFSHLLYKICGNLLLNQTGYQKRHTTISLEDLGPQETDDDDRDFAWRLIDPGSEGRDPEEIVQNRDQVSRLIQRANLTPLQSQVIKERLLGFSYKEIAINSGTSVGSARDILQEGLRRIRKRNGIPKPEGKKWDIFR